MFKTDIDDTGKNDVKEKRNWFPFRDADEELMGERNNERFEHGRRW